MDKILTIVVCAYNMEDYISEALESCKIKDMNQLEVLIMNDGSTDKTREICEKYCKEYPDVFILVNKENGGWGSNVNMAVKMATGKYFRILDADDWFNTGKLQEFVSNLFKIEASLVVTLHQEWIGKKIKKRDPLWENYKTGDCHCMKEIQDYIGLGIWKVTFQTSLVKVYHIELPENALYMDTLFILQLLPYVKKIYFMAIHVYDYRLSREGQSVSILSLGKHYQDLLLTFKKQLEFYLKMKETDNYKQLFYQFADTYKAVIIYLLEISSIKEIESGQMIEDCEIKLQHEAPEIYQQVGRRKIIKAMRFCNYRFCFILRSLYNFYHIFRD